MAINKLEYEKLKEYYDFQRKKEYNREQLLYAIKHITNKADIEIYFDEVWARLKEKDYQTPPDDWVPEDSQWQIEGEK